MHIIRNYGEGCGVLPWKMQVLDKGSIWLREAFMGSEEDFALYRIRQGSVSLCEECEARKPPMKFGMRG